MTTTIIILSTLLGLSLCFNVIQSAVKNHQRERIIRLKTNISALTDDMEAPFNDFLVRGQGYGVWAVYGVGLSAELWLIKKFDTADAEYNLNGAMELADNLGRDLCYD